MGTSASSPSPVLPGTSWRARLDSASWARWSTAATLLVLAALAGAGLGALMTSPQVVQPAREVFGAAWVADGESARGTLAGLLGAQLTLMGLVLSASTTALYGLLANQSLRLVGFIRPSRPLLHAFIGFAVTSGYVLAAVRRLGPPELEAPRPVVTVGIVLAISAVAAVVVDAAISLQKQEIGRMLGILTREIGRAIGVERARMHGAARAGPAAASLAGEVVRARCSGYVVDVAAARLLRDAVRLDARIRIDRTVGDYVVEGDAIGVVAGPSPLGVHAERRVARALLLGERRSPRLDPGAGVRALVDIAERALSPAVNDPYTACEVLYRLRGLLVELASVPDGDWVLRDDAGTVRVAVARPSFEERLRLAADGPSRYGASDPDVLDAVLEVASAVGRVPARRGAARRLVARVIADAAGSGMASNRRVLLERKARRVLADLGENAPIPHLWNEPPA